MSTRTNTLHKKAAAALAGLTLTLSVGVGVPFHTAHAIIPVQETGFNLVQNVVQAVGIAGMHTKDYVLDNLAWQVGNLAIQSMTKSLVTWINSGFQGSPAFVTDLKQNLRGVGDAVADRFFDELAQESIAKSPDQDKVLDAVRLAYYLRTSPESFYTKNPYTLYQVSPDPKSYLSGNFHDGGWNAWFSTVMNPSNNPYGAQMLANEALENAVAGATGERLEELSWNRGFLSWRGECTAKKPLVSAAQAAADASSVPLSGYDTCASYEIKTPGSVIMEQLNTQLGSNVNRLVSADEFNEIIGALMNQLVSQVLGSGNGGGLSGVSQPSAGGGSSYLDQATSASGTDSSSIASTFKATITNQKRYVTQYQQAWTKIRTAAQAAAGRCTNSGEPTSEDVITDANAALAKAANAMSALEALETRVTAANDAGGNQTSVLLEISSDYNELMSSNDILPSPEEISQAQSESQDTGDEEPASLYTEMQRRASGSCNGSGD